MPPRTAQAYRDATPETRRRAEAALAAALVSRQDAANELRRIMDAMSDIAAARGLTQEKLGELLGNDAAE